MCDVFPPVPYQLLSFCEIPSFVRLDLDVPMYLDEAACYEAKEEADRRQ